MENTVPLLSLLYELSLSTHKYLDPTETARKFIKKFLSRKSFQYGAIWRLTESGQERLSFSRVYSMPQLPDQVTIQRKAFEKVLGDADFDVRQGSMVEGVDLDGLFVYFRLSDFGILELHQAAAQEPEQFKASMYPFLDVINQLGTSIGSSYAYQLLEEEIVQREAAEKSLAAAEEKYRRIINNIHLGLLEVDKNDIIQYANEPFLQLTGYALEELVGQGAAELLLEEKSRALMAKHNADRDEGVSAAYEMPILDKQGNKRWTIISGAPNYDKEGNVIGSIGIHLDISEQKKLQDENAFKETQLKKLFEKSLDALITVNQRGEVIEWSPQAQVIFQYEEGEILGKKLSQTIIPHAYREAHETGMGHYMKSGEGPVLNQRIEITGLRKGGEEFPIELTIFPLKHQDRHYFTAFVRDITELKASRENMEKALKRQKELNDLKSKFISMTSHELRTPLTTIRSNTELANYYLTGSDEINRAKFTKFIARIDENVDRLNHLVSNILTIGKLDTKKFPFNPQPTDMMAFIDGEVLPSFAARGQHMTASKDGDPFRVNVDRTLFSHVFSNLIENAIKYSPKGKMPTLHCSYDDAWLHIMVHDEGIGIPEEDRAQLFEAFYRAGNVDNVSGSGLGLAIVKEFVELHEGRITVDSEVGKGSTFTVSLPKVSDN